MALNGTEPLTVSFTDTSIGEELSYFWNFGEGTSSSTRNPTHTYNIMGVYTVSLTVTNVNGSDTKSDTVVVASSDRDDDRGGE